MDKVIDKPKPPKDGQDKNQNKKGTKDNKYKPVVEDKSKKNSSWDQRMKETREIKDPKTRREAQGRLLEEKYPGFKYDPNKQSIVLQLDAWKNRDIQEIIGITIGFFGYNLSFQFNITQGKGDVSKSFSPTSLVGLSFDYEIGKGGSVGTELGLSDYFGIGAVWDLNDNGGADFGGFSISFGVGISTPVNVNIGIPENCEPFQGL